MYIVYLNVVVSIFLLEIPQKVKLLFKENYKNHILIFRFFISSSCSDNNKYMPKMLSTNMVFEIDRKYRGLKTIALINENLRCTGHYSRNSLENLFALYQVIREHKK